MHCPHSAEIMPGILNISRQTWQCNVKRYLLAKHAMCFSAGWLSLQGRGYSLEFVDDKSKSPLFHWAGAVVTNDWCICEHDQEIPHSHSADQPTAS